MRSEAVTRALHAELDGSLQEWTDARSSLATSDQGMKHLLFLLLSLLTSFAHEAVAQSPGGDADNGIAGTYTIQDPNGEPIDNHAVWEITIVEVPGLLGVYVFFVTRDEIEPPGAPDTGKQVSPGEIGVIVAAGGGIYIWENARGTTGEITTSPDGDGDLDSETLTGPFPGTMRHFDEQLPGAEQAPGIAGTYTIEDENHYPIEDGAVWELTIIAVPGFRGIYVYFVTRDEIEPEGTPDTGRQVVPEQSGVIIGVGGGIYVFEDVRGSTGLMATSPHGNGDLDSETLTGPGAGDQRHYDLQVGGGDSGSGDH